MAAGAYVYWLLLTFLIFVVCVVCSLFSMLMCSIVCSHAGSFGSFVAFLFMIIAYVHVYVYGSCPFCLLLPVFIVDVFVGSSYVYVKSLNWLCCMCLHVFVVVVL